MSVIDSETNRLVIPLVNQRTKLSSVYAPWFSESSDYEDAV